MTVYIEYVLIDNLTIDSLILFTCSQLARVRTSKTRIFLSSVFGTLIAVISPFLPNIINLLIKPVVAILMVIIAFKTNSFKKTLIMTILFVLITFLFGGSLIGVMNLLDIDYSLHSGINYQNSFPVGIAIAVSFVIYISTKNIINFCVKKQQNSQFIYDIVFQDGEKRIKTLAFLDSGNCVSIKNKPITIINFKTFNLLFPNISLTDLLLKKQLDLKNQNYVELASISDIGEKILTFEIDSITIENKKTENALIGLSLKDFSEKTNSDAIISNQIFQILGD